MIELDVIESELLLLSPCGAERFQRLQAIILLKIAQSLEQIAKNQQSKQEETNIMGEKC